MALVMDAELATLRGADYNPRRIDRPALEKLQDSLRTLGMVKPLIARDAVLVAGHQRMKALREMGVERAPVFFLGDQTNIYDEVRFNQLHNGTDLDMGGEGVRITEDLSGRGGFVTVPSKSIDGNHRALGAVVRDAICRLILKYGSWGACVAGEDGEVVHASQYALAARAVNVPLLVFVVPVDRKEEYRAALAYQYGVFSYEGIQRHTFIQTCAQMMRLRIGKTGKQNKSALYEKHVLPWLVQNRAARVLDFGCGQGDYVKRLSEQGYDITGLEFFRRTKGRAQIDVRAVNRMVDEVCRQLRVNGRWDAVVCDAVLNSVDSVEAETAVLGAVDALVKDGGRIFYGGRLRERVEDVQRHTKLLDLNSYLQFMDADGFSAQFRGGFWFFQRHHSASQVAAIAPRMGWTPLAISKSTTAFQCHVRQASRILTPFQHEQALRAEFNMEINAKGQRLGRHDDIAAAWLAQKS